MLKDARLDHSITENTTHIVVEAKPIRTLKVLEGMAKGLWIVKKDWIDSSIEKGKWLEEAPFEAKVFAGVKASRDNASKGVKLLANTKFFFHKVNPKINRDEVKRYFHA